ncbi:Vmc-like lipoprotein signal peptide domain-containing protein [Ureaplasma canigenitalium]|uniref:Vmc-like lipoprotein signal peptide domain-containing protein n=1 Tax=Ureaplasma canigenitalium TaxID=42092 RepID=UPI0004E0B899|nr:hypothetical protein [Ureaplasma canigenitalium]
MKKRWKLLIGLLSPWLVIPTIAIVASCSLNEPEQIINSVFSAIALKQLGISEKVPQVEIAKELPNDNKIVEVIKDDKDNEDKVGTLKIDLNLKEQIKPEELEKTKVEGKFFAKPTVMGSPLFQQIINGVVQSKVNNAPNLEVYQFNVDKDGKVIIDKQYTKQIEKTRKEADKYFDQISKEVSANIQNFKNFVDFSKLDIIIAIHIILTLPNKENILTPELFSQHFYFDENGNLKLGESKYIGEK